MSQQNPSSASQANQLQQDLQKLKSELNQTQQEKIKLETRHRNTAVEQEIRELEDQKYQKEQEKLQQQRTLKEAQDTENLLVKSNEEIIKKINDSIESKGNIFDYHKLIKVSSPEFNSFLNDVKKGLNGESKNIINPSDHPSWDRLYDDKKKCIIDNIAANIKRLK